MVGGKRRKSGGKRVLGSHQKCWLYGRHAVLETLRAGWWRPLEVWVADDLEADVGEEVKALAAGLEVDVERRGADELTRRCGGLAHQGLMAKMPPYPYAEVEAVLEAGGAAPFFLVLDGIQDPFNFGAILRSADVFGVRGVFVRVEGQSEVTMQVARSSAGAVNHVRIARVSDLAALLGTLRSRGVKTLAATGEATQTVGECGLTGACAVVIGNEGEGVSEGVLSACDERVRIPQSGHVESLNAAVAAGVLCYEVQRQRDRGSGA